MKRIKQLAILVLLGLISWQSLTWLIGEFGVPSPIATFSYLLDSFAENSIIEREGGGANGFWPHILSTTTIFLVSISVGLVLGIGIGVVIFQLGFVGEIAERTLEFFRVLPPLIFIPFFMLLVGSGYSAVIATGLLYCAYTSCFFTLSALRLVKKQFVDLSKLHGASKWQVWTTVLWPAIVPKLLSGLKLSAAIALGIIVVAEYLGSSYGLGRTMKFGVAYSNSRMLFCSVIWCVLVGLAFEWLLTTILGAASHRPKKNVIRL